jgi:hypothetical protein
MSKLTFDQKNDFVVKNATGKQDTFEKDLKLYRKCYPYSKFIKDCENANEFNRKDYDGRMLLEILDVVCPETVMENRGIIKDHNNDNTGNNANEKLLQAQSELAEADIDKMPYNSMKSLVMRLSIITENYKKQTIIDALKKEQKLLNAEPGDQEQEQGKDEKKSDHQE